MKPPAPVTKATPVPRGEGKSETAIPLAAHRFGPPSTCRPPHLAVFGARSG
jgi:hypothetical protein